MSTFRDTVQTWLNEACPVSIRGRNFDFAGGRKEPIEDADFQAWFDACAERGYTVPGWPVEYGGGGLSAGDIRILREEMGRIHAPTPLSGMGISMIGPTLLEHGSAAQKQAHLPKIARGEIRWCQGYSEPGAGSDLAALQTRAVDQGDHYLINGSKIWTSGADTADWIFCLVRTDTKAAKHEGISFVLFSMDEPGVTVEPIQLINGASPFCQCFFVDVKALKANLIGQENRGWTIAKRLLQHERSSISSGGGVGGAGAALPDMARRYGGITDPQTRAEVTSIEMDAHAFNLTQRRTAQENRGGGTQTFATSMFKYYASELLRRRMESSISLLGTQAVGWSGDGFSKEELAVTRRWLFGKALTIAGGSSEVQLNIIAKRVLGLPD